MQKQEKSRKPLIVGIIAAVVILAVLLVLLLTQCTGGQGDKSTTAATESTSGVEDYQLYWNLDRAEYSGKSEAGLSSRKPAEDGFFYVRFFYEGEVVTLKVADRRTINAIDVQDLMGLEFDENGVVVGVQKLDDLPLEKVGWQFFVQSADGTVIKLNSSENLNGMEIMLEEVDPNRVWDMSGRSGEPGTVCTPIAYDKVMAVQNLEGKTTHVFIYDRPNYMATHMAYCQHCDKEVEWNEWEKENDVPKTTGHYQLQNDIAYTGGQVALADETMICLDLNGYRIDGKANTRLYRLEGVAISFALMDTSEAQTGVVVGHGKSDQGGLFWVSNGAFYMYGGTLDGSGMTTQKYAPVVAINKGAYFYMYDGKIIGGTAKPTYVKETGKYSGGYAGSVYVQGKFVMNGGIIENGRAKSTITYKDGEPTYNRGYGGNILVTTGGVFEMNDGIIRGGKSDGQGGNIYTSSACEITMNGGSIQGGICYGKGKNGGNISLNNADAIFTMNGGSIVGGVSYNYAGNVYCAGQFIMNSGYIGSGALMKYGKNERNTSGTSYNMMVANGHLTLWGGTINGGVSIQDSKADGGYQTQLNIYGWAKVHGDENGKNLTIVKGGDDVVVNVGTLYNGADIYVNASGIFTKPTKEANLNYFHSDVENVDVIYYQECLALGKAVCICGASQTATPDAHDVGCNGEVLFWGPWTDDASLPNTTGNYYLTKDVTTTGQTTINMGQDVKVDLNGHNATLQVRTSSYDGFRLYRVQDGAKLAITDTQAKLTGKVGTLKTVMPDKDAVYSGADFTYDDVTYEGQAAKDKAREIWDKIGNYGMLLWARGGHISVHNGIFDGSNLSGSQTGMIWHAGSHSAANEAGVNTAYYGQINLYGGRVICGNLTGGYGAINANSGCALNVYGGTIENGVDDSKVKTRINVVSNGKLLLAGGNIDGGINVAGSVTLSGAPVVGNEDGGLYSAAAINIDGTLAAGAQVYTSKSGFITGETVEANKNYIFSTEGLDVTYMENKLFAAKMGCLCNYGKTVNGEKVTAHTAGCIAAMADIGLDPTKDKLQMMTLTADNYEELKVGGHFYLASDLTVGTASSAVDAVHLGDNTTLIIDLNGKTLTIYRAGMAFSTQNATTGNACLIITDTSAEGNGKIKVIGSGTNQGGIIRVWGKGGSNNRAFLLGGTLDASQYMLGNESKQVYGGTVEVHYGHKMYMYGGTVIGSQSDYISYGSAVNVNSSGSMYMYGGTIYGGKNADVSVVQNSNVFEMYGGTICGGLTSTTDKVKISGSAVINKALTPAGITVPAYSLKINSGKTVDFAGLTGEVYVTAGGKFGINADATIATLVKSDNPSGKVELDGTDLVMGYADRTNCECGGKLNGKYGHVCNEVVWKAWTSTDSLPTDGNWYLTGAVTVSSEITVPADVTIRLDLNGKTVTLSQGYNMYKFNGNANSTVVITDSVGGGKVVANGSYASNGGIMDIKDQNTVKIYNVTLDVSARTLAENGGIAAVRAGSHLTTYNVTIKGGLVAKAAGAFRMFNDGGLHVYGGTISGSKVTDKGGVLYGNGTGVLHFEDVTIEGSEAVGNGGVFCVSSTTQLTLKNCVITGAKTAGYGGALYQSGTAQVTISGTTTITANTTADGLNKSNIYVNGGKLIIADDFTGTIGLVGKTGAALVDNVTALDNKFITGGNIILDDPTNYRFVLVSGKLGMEEIPPEPRMQCVCGGVLAGTDGHTCQNVEFQPWTSTNSLPTEAGNYYLTKNVVLSAAAAIGADVNIDLNGKTVSNPDGTVLNVTAGTVTITDSTATAGAVSGGAGGVIKVSGTAILNLYAGTVTGGKSDDGAVQLTGTSKLNLAGTVQIVDNTTADGSATCNVVADGGTMAFLPGFSGNVRIAGAYGKLVVTGITSESDALLTGGKVALDDQSGNFKLVASAEGLTYGLANQDVKYACVCGGTLNGKYEHTCEKIFWEPWEETDSLPTANGNYYLKNTVNLASAGTVAEGATVRLDLNGKTVNLADTVRVYTFEDNYNSTLIITDTTSTPGSVIAVGTAGNGGILDVQEQNTAEIYNVTLDASARTITEHGSVAVVRPGSHLTTYNVTMKGGTTGTKKDGGVFRLVGDSTGTTDGGSVTVYGGTINGGTATYRGGVLYAKDNCAASFTDVSINGGTALRAGGFYISNTTRLTLKNTTINGCTSTGGYSGAIYADGANVVELDGVTIQNCTSTTAGGAILLNNKDAQLVIKGNTVITGNKMGDTKSNIAASYAKTVTIDPSFNGTVSFVAKKTGVALISGVTDLADPRLGVNILLDDPVSYAFALYEDGGVTYLGFKEK